MEARQIITFECDHLSPVVRDDLGHWRHVSSTGSLAGRCHSHGYRLDVTPADPAELQHTVTRAVRHVIGDPTQAGVLILGLLHDWYTEQLHELTMFIDPDVDTRRAELERVTAARREVLGVTDDEWARLFPQ